MKEADLRAYKLDAKVKGWAHLGHIELDFKKKVDVNIKTEEASVELGFKDLKGKVFLLSQKGSVKAPPSLSFKKSVYTQAKGSFAGEKKGKILVRTKKGDILLKRN